jgi:spore germination protein YaaH
VTFLHDLRADLPAAKSLSVCITNFTTPSQYRANGYDLAGIAKQVNQVVLMSYDQHGSWENTPGPVGALRWQQTGLRVMLRSVPAAKIDLGEAGYGYAWRPHSNYQISDAQARHLVATNHVTARWSVTAGEWTAQLPDGSTLWWADARSLRLRVTIARNQHLHGLAVWDLGLSDPIR